MITHVRRISLFVALVVAAVSAWSTSADATPAQDATVVSPAGPRR